MEGEEGEYDKELGKVEEESEDGGGGLSQPNDCEGERIRFLCRYFRDAGR